MGIIRSKRRELCGQRRRGRLRMVLWSSENFLFLGAQPYREENAQRFTEGGTNPSRKARVSRPLMRYRGTLGKRMSVKSQACRKKEYTVLFDEELEIRD